MIGLCSRLYVFTTIVRYFILKEVCFCQVENRILSLIYSFTVASCKLEEVVKSDNIRTIY